MDISLPEAYDHARIQILIKPLGNLDSLIFNRILQRLLRAESIDSLFVFFNNLKPIFSF